MKYLVAVTCFVLLVSFACRTGDAAARKRAFDDLYPSPTSEASQTPLVRVVTTTPLATQTPLVVVYTTTPVPTAENARLCVTAVEAVNLRPSPTTENFIAVLRNGQQIVDLGGRDGSWMFVQVDEAGKKRGWVKTEYVGKCKK